MKNRNETKKSWDAEPKNERANGKTKNRRRKRSYLRCWSGYRIRYLLNSTNNKKTEAKKKIELNSECPWPGCYKKGHKKNRSKLCKKWSKTNDDTFVTVLEIYLKSEYPDQYGKFPSHGTDDFSHPMVPTMLLQCAFIVFGGVSRFDVCLLWEIILKKVIFSFDFLLSALLSGT